MSSAFARSGLGSGGPSTIPNLARYLHSTRANPAFVSETKCSYQQAVMRINRLPLKNSDIVPAVNSSGGAIYGYPNNKVLGYIWDRVLFYATTYNLPLCIIGDFNCILGENEKQGGTSKIKLKNKLFASLVARAGLIDLGYSGPAYTWSNKRQRHALIKQRLDRAMANSTWVSRFPNAKVLHLPMFNSDHMPILLKTSPTDKRRMKQFRTENWWHLHSDFKEVCVNFVINSQNDWGQFISNLKKNTRKWESTKPSPTKDLQHLEAEWYNLQQMPADFQNQQQLQQKYNEALVASEVYWAQRSRLRWAFFGDSNSKLFHITASAYRRKNQINSIKSGPDLWAVEEHEIRAAFVSYFKSIFCQPPNAGNISLNTLNADMLRAVPRVQPHFANILNQTPSE
ncbi:hypothetical protein LUZ63_014195 [Rhynchospora breviuscula]|uniref:Endonuclease/exonuclease/phosphatase domain-containing protein n=1 Tax=Rhynchospora breviuscula TaxID=2022672 RepID=A0A9Q0CA04_9POAL|nr:hypothetical protein LUZ63_014195 [Rhynchospora breviuscula]